MGFYCMVDRPDHGGSNKPRREHPTEAVALAEAKRLAKRTKSRVVVLQVVHAENPPPQEEQHG